MNRFSKFSDAIDVVWTKYKRPILIAFLLAIAYIFYCDQHLFELIKRFIISPYLSNFSPSSLFNIPIFIATIVFLSLNLNRSWKNKPIPSLEINISLSTILVILTIERFRLSGQVKFVPILPNLSYYDFTLITIFCFILIALIPYVYFWFSEKESKEKSSFTKDFTGDSKELPEDKLGRKKFAEEIGKQILNLEQGNGSFCLGIEGSWGSGKSFMLNLIDQNISGKAITINFNPWKGNETKNIFRDFFFTLSESLSKYDKSINNKLIRYYTVLSDDNSGSIWYYLKNFLFNTQSLQGISEKINERLTCLKQPIVIFIDDIDRLQADEIFDLLKLIRNISNFNNTIFVVAFDQEYLQNVLTTPNKANLNFIDKIFQVVFHLPQIDVNSFQSELIERIASRIYKGKKEHIDDLTMILSLTIRPHENLTFKILDTPRDIIRFSNQIVVHHKFISDTDYSFEDFFILELIRYRFPQLISWLINKPDFFFVEENSKYILRPKFSERFGAYYEQISEQEMIIPDHLVPKDREFQALSLLSLLFGSSRINDPHNSIQILTNYYRYFSLSIFNDDLLFYEFKQAVQSDSYEKNLLTLVTGKKRQRIIHLFDQLIEDSLDSTDKMIKLINSRRSYNDSINSKNELLREFYNFLKQIVEINKSLKKMTNIDIEDIILFCLRSKHDAEQDIMHLNTFLNHLPYKDSVSEIGISFENHNKLAQELFNEIITKEYCSLDAAYYAWIYTKFSPESGKSPQPSTKSLRKFIVEKFKIDFIERFYSVLDAPRGFETYVNLQTIFPTMLEEKSTPEFRENLAIIIQIIKNHYEGQTNISTFLMNSIIPEMQKLKLSKSEQINQFSEIIINLDLPGELKEEVRDTFKNSIN